jgi:exopolyphosphatase/guanosine-5'-triphosphate,3'-diphosphate pyrophosphatase
MMARVERVAVIDMGSNSWRLVVFGYEPGTPWWSLVDEIREAVRISAGMVERSDPLRPERVELALHTAAVFSAFCRARGIDRIEAVATSAIRDAANGPELLDRIRDQTGLTARVISGEEEARYGWLAIANSTTLDDGFGLDMGGGSIQTLRLEGRRLRTSASLPLGSVRVSEEFLPGEKATPKGMRALRERVAADLRELGWWGGSGRLVGIGGTIRNLAAAAMKRLDLPDIDAQGFALTRDALEGLIEELAARPASKRGGVRGIKPDRGDVILGGALVLAATLDEGGFDSIEVTGRGCARGSSSRACWERASCSWTSARSRSRTSPTASTRTRTTSTTSRGCRWRYSTGSRQPACTSSATATASCSGPLASSTTSARRSTTTTTTATRST